MKLALVLVAGLVALVGCGAGDGSPNTAGAPISPVPQSATGAPASAEYNDADVMFLQMMLAHNSQGVEIVKLVPAKQAQKEELKNLAAAIEATQQTESTDMRNWLKAWGKPETGSMDPHAHHHHGGDGLTDKGLLEALSKKDGQEFTLDFADIFVAHQHNGVALARTELKDGKNPESKALAQRIMDSRTGEVQQIRTLVPGQ
ncbi:DUF305 domain-containing protein [Amycolatopsis sp. BJA-103]|uniref:DUF305 domain-containing protein n=1 Tax=unclassified Amycolatopsis TaxID=2618356 RepID=UPI000C78293C|nr:DUF305 domain-containing protein [Amycolatopsis sp. BJA-103]AUI62468.1 DUF305 domain-containing protein [Amycolatopsis sp. BJA-103]PNE18304.1 DUF305 domain-containing protein [Amycolatopsis sp. BJA-103]